MTGSDLVTLEECSPGVFELTMTSSHRRNALSSAMVSALVNAMDEAGGAGCRALILRAEPGATSWSAGFDIGELPRDPADTWPHPMAPITHAIRHASFPVIAAVEGGAWGGGLEVAFTCDLVVATHDAVFALTPARLGVAYDAPAIERLCQRMPRQVVAELIMSAHSMSAQRLHDLGVVNAVVDGSSGLTSTTRHLAQDISANAPLTIAAAKAVIAGLPTTVIADRTRRAWTSSDYREGVSSFQNRRSPEFTGE